MGLPKLPKSRAPVFEFVPNHTRAFGGVSRPYRTLPRTSVGVLPSNYPRYTVVRACPYRHTTLQKILMKNLFGNQPHASFEQKQNCLKLRGVEIGRSREGCITLAPLRTTYTAQLTRPYILQSTSTCVLNTGTAPVYWPYAQYPVYCCDLRSIHSLFLRPWLPL